MDNYIYDNIADYQDWVRLHPPVGGAAEIERIKQGGKMKNEIKKLKERASGCLKQLPNNCHAKNVLYLIAEIESLKTEIKQLQAVREAAKAIDWEGIILLVDEYPVEVVKLRKLQRALAAKGKDA